MSLTPSAALPALVAPGADLTPVQAARYARHLTLPDIGLLGQRRLLAARVLVLGAGGLGSPALLYLAAAGVGTIGIVDSDRVDLSNLQRQVIHASSAVGTSKVASATARIAELNPDVTVIGHEVHLDASNVLEIFRGYDLVLDGTDNFATRYLVNDACAMLGLPYVWGSVLAGHGQVSTFWAEPPVGAGVEYRDVFGDPPPAGAVPSCVEAGVLGAVCASIGSAMVIEAIRLICGRGRSLLGRIQVHDAMQGTWREIPVAANPALPRRGRERDLAATLASCGVAPAGAGVGIPEITTAELAFIEPAARVVVDLRSDAEIAGGMLPDAHHVPITAWEDSAEAPAELADLAALAASRDAGLIFICASGIRSARAVAKAATWSIPSRSLAGGMNAWSRAT